MWGELSAGLSALGAPLGSGGVVESLLLLEPRPEGPVPDWPPERGGAAHAHFLFQKRARGPGEQDSPSQVTEAIVHIRAQRKRHSARV